MSYEFEILGKPIAKMRPKFGRSKKGVVTYDLQSAIKREMRLEFKLQSREKGLLRPLTDILRLEMTFGTPIPASWSQKRSKCVLDQPDPRRPDLDNYVKFYLDVMNGIVYEDDKQVAELWCKKVFCDKPKVNILIHSEPQA